MKLVVYLCFADLISNLSTFIITPFEFENNPDYKLTFNCRLQAYLKIFADLSSIIWCCIISFTIFISIIKKKKNL